MRAGISESDIRQMNLFPQTEKSRVMEAIMSLTPLKTEMRSDANYYEKSLISLRKEGFGLIDLQPLETALTTVWYRRAGRLPARFAREDVTMLLWESQDDGEATTVIHWRI